MDDDFNTGGAVGVLFELVNTLNRLADSAKLEDPAKADAAGKLQFEEGALSPRNSAKFWDSSSRRRMPGTRRG